MCGLQGHGEGAFPPIDTLSVCSLACLNQFMPLPATYDAGLKHALFGVRLDCVLS